MPKYPDYEKLCINISKDLSVKLEKEVQNSNDFGTTKSMVVRQILKDYFKTKEEK